MQRIPSGIIGLDELIEGGFPEGSSILISGGPGAGKTIAAMQFIYEGARTYGEPGLYVTLESNLKDITWNMQRFNWDIKSMQEKNLMKIYRLNLGNVKNGEAMEEQIQRELEIIARMVDSIGAKRLAIDSTTSFGVWIQDQGSLRHILFEFVNKLKDIGCTTVLTSEVANEDAGKNKFSAFGVEEFVVDGVIALYFVPPNRSIFIRKLRGTNHTKAIHAYDITDKGIEVRPRDEMLWSSLR